MYPRIFQNNIWDDVVRWRDQTQGFYSKFFNNVPLRCPIDYVFQRHDEDIENLFSPDQLDLIRGGVLSHIHIQLQTKEFGFTLTYEGCFGSIDQDMNLIKAALMNRTCEYALCTFHEHHINQVTSIHLDLLVLSDGPSFP